MSPSGESSESYLESLSATEKTKANRVPGVQKVLVVLSSAGIVFDMESLRQKILLAYKDAAVFFKSTSGKPMGVASPQKVDLLIDLTGPGQRQGFFAARRLRRMTRFAVGRNVGFFRKRDYHRVFDEKVREKELSKNTLERERRVQREVLALAGVPFLPAGDTTPDLGRSIALDLPPLSKA